MIVGLAGSPLSADLGILKREIEDRGHKAVIFNLRKVPQYTFASIGASGSTTTLVCDHRDLTGVESLYIGDFEGRDRFFRGWFDKDIWVSLRDRYLDFAAAEVDALAFQMSLLVAAADRVPTVNSPASIVGTRLRPYVHWKIGRAGLPLWPFEIRAASSAAFALRIRPGEEACYDVPCFPREMKHTLSLVARAPAVTWRMIAVAGAEPGSMVVTEADTKRAAAVPAEAAHLACRLLDLFALAVAEVHLAAEGSSPSVLDVRPFPRLAEFEEITSERSGALVAERLLEAGG